MVLGTTARRGAAQDGSRTCVAPQDQHRPRRGRTRRLVSAPVRIARSRPQPQARSCPARHEGLASAPDARSADAAPGSAHSRIGALPSHGTTVPRRAARLPGAVRVAGCQAGRRPATGSQVTGGNDTVSGRQQRARRGRGSTGTRRAHECGRARNEIHARPELAAMLTLNDANRPQDAQREWRLTTICSRVAHRPIDSRQGP